MFITYLFLKIRTRDTFIEELEPILREGGSKMRRRPTKGLKERGIEKKERQKKEKRKNLSR